MRTFLPRLIVLPLLAFSALNPGAFNGSPPQGTRMSFYSVNTAPILRGFSELAPALGSVRFVRSVGGVAFGGTATGTDGIKVKGLRYEPANPDGSRLSVAFDDGRTVVAAIRDWQLKPIAQFVQDGEVAVFTLFGALNRSAADSKEEYARLVSDIEARWRQRGRPLSKAELDRIEGDEKLGDNHDTRLLTYKLRKMGGFAGAYHEAFKDTLLGVRLMQADMLAFHEMGCELPTIGPVAYRAEGEDIQATEENLKRLALFRTAYRNRFEETLGEPSEESYVVCDHGQQVAFSAKNGLLELTGDPYWYFWNVKREIEDEKAEKLTYKEAVRHLELTSKYISKKMVDLNGINPSVYAALKNVMRYSAFLRSYKKADPSGFDAFVASLSGIDASRLSSGARISTPTVMLPTQGRTEDEAMAPMRKR